MRALNITYSLTYTPFAELDKNKVKKMNPEKKAKERERFAGTCKICGEPLTFIPDTNILVCSNPECKGKAVKQKGETTNRIPTYRLLEKRSARYAEILFEN